MTLVALASPIVSHVIEHSVTRPTPLGASVQLSLAGRALDARLPLSLLESVRAIDTPEAELDAELVHELRNKRLGLSDTVYMQIKRYSEAVRRSQRIPYDEVLALARLIGRRPDADLAFRESGRRWARSASLPAFFGRPIALRQLRRIARRHFDGVIVRQGSTLLLDIKAPVSVDAAPNFVGCGMYEAAFRESLLLLCGAEGAVDHVMCLGRGDTSCQWRADWRRR